MSLIGGSSAGRKPLCLPLLREGLWAWARTEGGRRIRGLGREWTIEIVASLVLHVGENQTLMEVTEIGATMNAMGLRTPGKENPGFRLSLLRLLIKHGQVQPAGTAGTAGLISGEIELIKVGLADEWSQTRMFQTMGPEVTAFETEMTITRASRTMPTGATNGTIPREGEAEARVSDMAGMA